MRRERGGIQGLGIRDLEDHQDLQVRYRHGSERDISDLKYDNDSVVTILLSCSAAVDLLCVECFSLFSP